MNTFETVATLRELDGVSATRRTDTQVALAGLYAASLDARVGALVAARQQGDPDAMIPKLGVPYFLPENVMPDVQP